MPKDGSKSPGMLGIPSWPGQPFPYEGTKRCEKNRRYPIRVELMVVGLMIQFVPMETFWLLDGVVAPSAASKSMFRILRGGRPAPLVWLYVQVPFSLRLSRI